MSLETLTHHEDGSTRLRCCRSCPGVKPATDFPLVGNGKYRYSGTQCRACVAKRVSAWQKANPERHNARIRRYYAANPSKKKAIEAIRRASRRGLNVTEKAQLAALYAEAARLTALHGVPMEIHHVKAIAIGGTSHPRNLAIVSRSCNRSAASRAHRDHPPALREEIERGRLLADEIAASILLT